MATGDLPPSIPPRDESFLLRGPRHARARDGTALDWWPALLLAALLAASALAAAWGAGLLGG